MSQAPADTKETRLPARVAPAEQTEFRLPPEQWEAFRRRLDASPQSIPALSRLFAEPEPWGEGRG